MIKAAGGIVWKKISGKYKIALVYRERYGGKWSLPKGKLDEGESWEDAAVREIAEEVSVKATIVGFADAITYPVDGKPKIVLFYQMLAEGESEVERDPEVVKIAWVSPHEALDMMAYAEEKELVKNTDLSDVGKGTWKKRIRTLPFLPGFTLSKYSAREERLSGDLKTFRKELEFRITSDSGANQSSGWAQAALVLLKMAGQEQKKGSIDTAWKAFHAAQRMQFHGFTPSQLEDEAKVIREESGKLNAWRREIILKLIGTDEHPAEELDPLKLIRSAALRDEHYSNNYYKNRIVRKTILLLLGILVFLMLVQFIYLTQTNLEELLTVDTNGERTIHIGPLILGVLLFGLLGGCISSLFHIRDSSKTTRIPEILNNNFITFTRVVIGGASAVFIFFFLESGISDFLLEGITLRPDSVYTIFTVSFVAGFSERLLLRAVSSIVGKD